MEQNSFNFNGKDVVVIIDKNNGHKFYTIENGNTLERLLKSFTPNYNAKTIKVDWVNILKDSQGNVLKSEVKDYIQSSEIQYDFFYNLQNFQSPAGDIYAKHCINGIMEREIGYKCFNEDGVFINNN